VYYYNSTIVYNTYYDYNQYSLRRRLFYIFRPLSFARRGRLKTVRLHSPRLILLLFRQDPGRRTHLNDIIF